METFKMQKFSEFEFRTQPWFQQSAIQRFARNLIPMKTLVIYCLDPRATEIPEAVAAYFGDEVYPGELVLDEEGHRIGSTRTLFTETNAGGRAEAALQSIVTMKYLFDVQNVVVVHHSFCGASAITPDVLIDEFKHEHHSDISDLFDRESLSIPDFEKSLEYDVKLLRSSPAVPQHVKLYGFFYEINTGKLVEVVRDIPE